MVKKRKPTHPGIILEEHYINPLGIDRSTLADAACISRNTLYRILSGKSRITANVAVRLSKALKTTPALWLNLQQKYDVWEAENNKDLKTEHIRPIVSLVAKTYR